MLPEAGLTTRRAAAIGCALYASAWLLVPAAPVRAQVEAHPVLRGRITVGDSAAGERTVSQGTVILHHVGSETQGELDSTHVARDGTFSFNLTTVPDPERNEVYFASIRYQGVLYFGPPVTLAVQLDSVYRIHAYDTITAPAEGVPLPVSVRNTFVEPREEGDGWRITDLFQVRNDSSRTLVAREGGVVWRYPLAEGASQFTVGQSEFAVDAIDFEAGALQVRAAIAPGERLFVIRYVVDDPVVKLPVVGTTDTMELLVREPAPALDVRGLEAVEPVDLEAGTTYRRYTGSDLVDTMVEIEPAKEPGAPPVRLAAVLLALALAAFGGWAIMRSGRAPPAPGPEDTKGGSKPSGAGDWAHSREALVVEVARLDEDFDSNPSPSADQRARYEARRRELLDRLKAGG